MLTKHAETILKERYLLEGETPDDMFRRAAKAVASADKLYGASDTQVEQTADCFYRMMSSLDFLPNSPTLMNAGTELGQLAACFVLPIDDSIEGIFDAVKHTAIIQKTGGGTGFSFSRLRPEGDPVQSTAKVASGPVSFMRVFHAATSAIKQGGRRRGANMAVLRVDHPDIEKFITVKNDPTELTTFNLSVAVTDDFMNAVKDDAFYNLVNPRTGEVVKQESSRRIFRLIAESAWRSGEPGLLFIDRIERANPTPELGAIEATNPCGEAPLLPFEACNLGSINLRNMVRNGKIDRVHLGNVVRNAIHFLDNVIDVNKYPLPEIRRATQGNRKIGLGVMGFADMLIELGIPYDSDDAVETARTIMRMIRTLAQATSAELAHRRGPFPNFSQSAYAHKRNGSAAKLRNATTTTIAPTGTISLIAGCSSGIEPLFAVSWRRKALDNRELHCVHPAFIRMAQDRGFLNDSLLEEISHQTSVQHISAIPEDVRRLFRTAHDIDPEWHLRIQAAFQEYTDNAVSKTINLPASATIDDVEKLYLMAYELTCKGVTVYRDGSRQGQVLSAGNTRSPSEPSQTLAIPAQVGPRERPATTRGATTRINTGCGKLYVTVNCDEHGPFEVFAQMGKAGGCPASQIEAVCRLISLALRSGIRPDAVVKQLAGIRCPLPVWHDGRQILSCADAISIVLSPTRSVHAGSQNSQAGPFQPVCPRCGTVLTASEGCFLCLQCGFSRCS